MLKTHLLAEGGELAAVDTMGDSDKEQWTNNDAQLSSDDPIQDSLDRHRYDVGEYGAQLLEQEVPVKLTVTDGKWIDHMQLMK